MSEITVYFGDNLDALEIIPDSSVSLIYIEPSFNTGMMQQRTSLQTIPAEDGDRTRCASRRYKTFRLSSTRFGDIFDDRIKFLYPRIVEAKRILGPNGSLFLHLDCWEVHYCKVMLEGIFGRASFINEIIWAYDYGCKSKRKWPAKHDNILWYAKDPENYIFNYADMDRIPYMAPGLVGEEKAKRGKTPTDVWWHTIALTNEKENTGYATQKPLGILERIVKIHSNKGDVLCDFFAGSGSFGVAAYRLGRNCILADINPQAITIMRKRFSGCNAIFYNVC